MKNKEKCKILNVFDKNEKQKEKEKKMQKDGFSISFSVVALKTVHKICYIYIYTLGTRQYHLKC